MLRAAQISAIVLLAWSPCAGQSSSPCSNAQIPAAIALPDGRLMRGLNATHLRVYVDGRDVRFDVSVDTTPRRILLLVETSKRADEQIRKAMFATASDLMQRARPEDRFALVTFGGLPQVAGFDESRQTVKEKLKAAIDQPGETGQPRLLDAIADGAKLFGEPAYGDSLFLIIAGEDYQSRVSVAHVDQLVVNGQLRIFGVAFGRTQSGAMYVGLGSNVLIPFIPDNDFHKVVFASGGFMAVGYSGNPWRTFKLTDEVLKDLQTSAWRVYGQIVETYRITVVRQFDVRVSFGLGINEVLRVKFPNLRVWAPSRILPCSGK